MFKLVTVEMLKETQDKIIIDNAPSLSTVMTVGNTANMELNMASNAIVNVGDISGQTINLNTSSLKLNGEVGTPGKILTVNLLGKPSWGESKNIIPTLEDVMYEGNTAGTNLNMNGFQINNVTSINGQIILDDESINLNTNSFYLDANNILLNGTEGQTGEFFYIGESGPTWKTIESVTTPTLSEVMNQGNIAGATLNMNNYDITNVKNINIKQLLQMNNDSGISGYVLTSQGSSAPIWKSIPSSTTPSLAQVMAVGNTAGANLNMNELDIINVNEISGNNINLQTNTLYINGSSGTVNQVLTVGTTGPKWQSIQSATTPSLAQVMAVGNSAGKTLDMSYNDIIRVHGISGSNMYLTTDTLYVNGSSGTVNQVLTVGTTGPKWQSIQSATTPSLAQVMAVGNSTGKTLDMSNNSIIRVSEISGNNINLQTNTLYVNGSSGTTGQVLTVGTTGPKWQSIQSAITPTLSEVMTTTGGNTAGKILNMSGFDITYANEMSSTGYLTLTALNNNIILQSNGICVRKKDSGVTSVGETGQVLTSNGEGFSPSWETITSGSTAGLSSVLDISNNAGTHDINMNSRNINNVNYVRTRFITSDSSNNPLDIFPYDLTNVNGNYIKMGDVRWQTLPNGWATQPPICGFPPTLSDHLVRKDYVDTNIGICKLFTTNIEMLFNDENKIYEFIIPAKSKMDIHIMNMECSASLQRINYEFNMYNNGILCSDINYGTYKNCYDGVSSPFYIDYKWSGYNNTTTNSSFYLTLKFDNNVILTANQILKYEYYKNTNLLPDTSYNPPNQYIYVSGIFNNGNVTSSLIYANNSNGLTITEGYNTSSNNRTAIYIARYNKDLTCIGLNITNYTTTGSSCEVSQLYKTNQCIYISGIFTNTVNFGNNIIKTSDGNDNVFIAKYNNNLVCQWVNTIVDNPPKCDSIITCDIFNNVYISNYTTRTTTITDSGGNTIINNPTNNSLYIIKYNSNGIYQSIYTTTTSPNEYKTLHSIIYNNVLYVLLYVGNYLKLYTYDINDLQSMLNIEVTLIEEYNYYNNLYSICNDNYGNIILSGTTSNSTLSIGSKLYTGNQWTLIVKYSNIISNTILWSIQISNSTINTCSQCNIVSDYNSNVYVVGAYTSGAITIKDSTDTNVGTFPTTSSTQYNTFIIKYNSEGIIVWKSVIYNSGTIGPRYMSINKDNNTLNITGVYNDPSIVTQILDSGIQSKTFDLVAVGNPATFVATYDCTNGDCLHMTNIHGYYQVFSGKIG